MAKKVLIAAASFEDRSKYWVREFVKSGGDPKNVFFANVEEPIEEYSTNYTEIMKLGVPDLGKIDRFSPMSLWNWVTEVVTEASKIARHLDIDITCMPRELLGMLLFAFSTDPNHFESIWIKYVKAPEGGYATVNSNLPEDQRWLSKRISSIRSIIGYPGEFLSERPCHLIVFAGHEYERIVQIVEYMEPRRLTVSGEMSESSIFQTAGEVSSRIAKEIQSKIQVPEIGDIEFSSSSIEGVYDSLQNADLFCEKENVALAAMNTKLSFVGAALFALANRKLRMMYAVPSHYNPKYCEGVGKVLEFEITSMIRQANV
ncbi:MAG: hypothetical protein OXC17_01825 [Aestuariivita sp.]|nr:hypothetical protein [Aestuariivita sp.]